MSNLLAWDEKLFLWLNGFHTPWLDSVMFLITGTWIWLPLYLILLYLIILHYKKDTWLILAGIGLAILLSDRITSGLMKPFFGRLRPSHEPGLSGLVHTVNGYEGGLYGFASSHASNLMAIALFVWLLFKDIYRWTVAIFGWTVIVIYSRIYLGVHYPGDVIVGSAVGLASGWAGWLSYTWIKTVRDSRKNGPGHSG